MSSLVGPGGLTRSMPLLKGLEIDALGPGGEAPNRRGGWCSSNAGHQVVAVVVSLTCQQGLASEEAFALSPPHTHWRHGRSANRCSSSLCCHLVFVFPLVLYWEAKGLLARAPGHLGNMAASALGIEGFPPWYPPLGSSLNPTAPFMLPVSE